MYINRNRAQAERTITVSGPAIPVTPELGLPLLELRALRGREKLSEIYEYVLELVTPSEPWVRAELAANLDLKKMVGRALTVSIELEGMGAMGVGAGRREISGLVFEARYMGQEDRRGRYEVILKPWIALAEAHTDYRIYQNQSVIEIIDDVLGNYPFASENRLGEDYPWFRCTRTAMARATARSRSTS